MHSSPSDDRRWTTTLLCAPAIGGFAFLALVIALFPTGAGADSGLVPGNEFRVNTATTSVQRLSAIAAHDDGSFVVVWQGDDTSGPGEQDVFAQRYDSSGAPLGTEFIVNTYTTSSYQGFPDVSAHADGRFVVVWEGADAQDGDARGVFGRRFGSDGSPVGAQFAVNTYTTGDQEKSHVAVASDGTFVVVWLSDGQDGSGYGAFGRRFDSAGSPLGGEFMIATHTTGDQTPSGVAVRGDGAFVVAFADLGGRDGDGRGMFARRYDSAGAPIGADFQVNSYTTGDQRGEAVAVHADGSFVFAWGGESATEPGTDPTFEGISARSFTSDGVPVGPQFAVNTYTSNAQLDAAIATHGDGSFVVTWESYDQDGDHFGVFGQRLDSAGSAIGAEFIVNSYTPSYQLYQEVASLGGGGFVVTWSSFEQDGSDWGVYARRYALSELCDEAPQPGCGTAAQAKLDYNESRAGGEKMKLQWKKIAAATTQAGFGDPVGGSTEVAVCLYGDDDVLVQELLVDRAGDDCDGKPCWRARGTKGFSYKDKPASAAGIAKLSFGGGDPGKGKVSVQGANSASKGQTALPTDVASALAGNTAPTVELLTSDGFCVSATMNVVKKDTGVRYSAQLK